jgi:hypothetical protein
MHRFASLVLFIALGCQSAPQTDDSAGGAGGTAQTPGTPATVRTDTTGVGSAQSGDVTLSLDRDTYAPGATATMTIRNRGRDTLGFNQCSSRSVEQQQGSGWVAHPEPDRMCTMELRLLNPNETQTATTDIPATLPRSGVYRMVLTLGLQRATPSGQSAGTVRATSQTFRVN